MAGAVCPWCLSSLRSLWCRCSPGGHQTKPSLSCLGLNPCLWGFVGRRRAPASPPLLFWDKNAIFLSSAAGFLCVGWAAAGRGCLLPAFLFPAPVGA